MVYTSTQDIDFSLDEVPFIPSTARVLLTSPKYFDVQYVINPHMEGQIGSVDHAEALQQWKAVREAYQQLSIPALAMEGVEGLPDMVFCANQSLPFYDPRSGRRGVVLSRMHAPQRRDEVSHYSAFFEQQGYDVVHLPSTLDKDFEGMGDAIWHPNRYLLWGGYGFRTDRGVYEFLAEKLDLRVIALKLADPEFYHLDTCFSALNETSVLIYPGAFTDEDLALMHHFFETVIEAPEDESRRLLACNAHCPDGEHVIIQEGCDETTRMLRDAGFAPLEIATDEFLKAGGSVFCMKQMIW